MARRRRGLRAQMRTWNAITADMKRAAAKSAAASREATTMRTPWGESQGKPEGLALGCMWVDTPSHGGLFVPWETAKELPPAALRLAHEEHHAAGVFFEEDCAYAVAFLALPEVERTARDWAIRSGNESPDDDERRRDLARTVATWYGPEVLRACGWFDLAAVERQLRYWVTRGPYRADVLPVRAWCEEHGAVNVPHCARCLELGLAVPVLGFVAP